MRGGEETDVNLKFIERDETREREVIKKDKPSETKQSRRKQTVEYKKLSQAYMRTKKTEKYCKLYIKR